MSGASLPRRTTIAKAHGFCVQKLSPVTEKKYSRMFSRRGSRTTFIFITLFCSFVLGSCDEEIRVATVDTAASKSYNDSSLLCEVSSECQEEIKALGRGIAAGEWWAIQMVDAASKLQSGILKGNIRDLGMYDECVGIRPEQNSAHIQGRHCVVSVSFSSTSNVSHIKDFSGSRSTVFENFFDLDTEKKIGGSGLGVMSSICVPSACNSDDVVRIANTILTQTEKINMLGLNISGASCAEVTPDDVSSGEILTIMFLAIVGIFIVSSTLCDWLLRRKVVVASDRLKTVSEFSILKSASTVFSTKISSGTVREIHGIRFLSLCWIIIGHRYGLTLLKPQVNLFEVLNWKTSWQATYVLSAPFAVDTFLLISGFLMTRIFLQTIRSGNRMSVFMMYLHRYLRLTPALVVVILFSTFLLPRIGSGAIWKPTVNMVSEVCKDTWWRYLLYIQNYSDNVLCLGPAWYLAVDMHLFWISPLIIYPLHHWPTGGLNLLWAYFIASIITPAAILATNEYANIILDIKSGPHRIVEQILHLYIPTHCRATPYLAGIFLGYEITTKTRTLSKARVATNWLISLCLLLFCSINIHYLYVDTYVYNIYWETIFAAVSRLFWSAGIAWIIFACTQGYGGPVSTFLSLPLFQPLSRLSYCTYLVHFQFQVAENASVRTAEYFSDYYTFTKFWSDLALSLALASVLCFFFEIPMIVLEKILTGSDNDRSVAATLQQTSSDNSEERNVGCQA